MNRAELVEKAARASHRQGLECGGEYAEWDALREITRREYRENAEAVVDALLPQVSTVEELEALDDRSVLVFEAPNYNLVLRFANGRLRADSWVGSFEQAIAELGPLTVVWSPS